jgi:hypothetical protein
MSPRTALFFSLVLLLSLSCVRPAPQDGAVLPAVETEALPEESSGPLAGIRPWAIIEPGENPLWFELGPEGPRLISSPAEASLAPFSPWPLARNITGLLAWEHGLVMGVNRGGLLLWAGGPEGGLSLYYLADSGWDPYAHASLFLFQGEPAVLLYRDDFFLDSEAALPSPRVWGLSREGGGLLARDVPAFGEFPAEEGWDLDMLRLGRDGLWYYRGVRKAAAEQEIRYLRGADLGFPGEATSPGVFRNATVPYTQREAPPLLESVLHEAFRLGGAGQAQTAAVVSPDFPAARYYAGDAPLGEELIELAGYLETAGPAAADGVDRTGGPDEGLPGEAGAGMAEGATEGYGAVEGIAEGFALVIRPDGRGVYGKAGGLPGEPAGEGPEFRIAPFSLPPLPEGFAYTWVGLRGSAVVAAWEEQQSWQIGAAGFLVIRGIPF